MKMNNLDVRLMVSDAGIRYRDIAKAMNVTPEWLSKLLRDPLSAYNKSRVLDAIESVKRDRS